MEKTQKRSKCKMMLAIALLFFGKNYASAQTWSGTLNPGSTYRLYTQTVNGNENGFRVESYTDPNFDGKTYESVGGVFVTEGGTSAIQFNTTKPVLVSGRIAIENGHLQVGFGDEATYDHPTLKRANGNETLAIFRVYSRDTNENGCKLSIIGNENGNIVIDGGCEGITIDSSDMRDIQFSHVGGTEAQQALIVTMGGSLSLDKVTMKNNWNNAPQGGAIYVTYADLENKKKNVVNMTIV